MSMSQSTLSVLQWTSANLTEILIAAAIGAALVALLYGIRALLLRTAKRLSTGQDVAGVLANAVRKTRLWFIVALVVRVEQGYLHPPEDIAKTMLWVAELPPHLNINSLELMPVNQAFGPFAVHRAQ